MQGNLSVRDDRIRNEELIVGDITAVMSRRYMSKPSRRLKKIQSKIVKYIEVKTQKQTENVCLAFYYYLVRFFYKLHYEKVDAADDRLF